MLGAAPKKSPPARPGILLLGGNGQLGSALAGALAPLGDLKVITRAEADLGDPGAHRRLGPLLPDNPRLIVNAAAYTKVDLAETERKAAEAVNALAPASLAHLAKERGALLIHFSTDYVYDGRSESPYTEESETGPLNQYGATKLEGDRLVMESGARHVILRTSWVYGPAGHNFPHTILRLAKTEKTLEMNAAQRGAPTSTELLSAAVSLIAFEHLFTDKKPSGLFHLTAGG